MSATPCPSCSTALGFPADRTVDVRCPSCGLEFGWDPEAGVTWLAREEPASSSRPSEGGKKGTSEKGARARRREKAARQKEADEGALGCLGMLLAVFVGAFLGSIVYPDSAEPKAWFGIGLVVTICMGWILNWTDQPGRPRWSAAMVAFALFSLGTFTVYGPAVYDGMEVEQRWGLDLLASVGLELGPETQAADGTGVSEESEESMGEAQSAGTAGATRTPTVPSGSSPNRGMSRQQALSFLRQGTGQLTVSTVPDIQEIRVEADTLFFMRTDSTNVYDTSVSRVRRVGRYWTMHIDYSNAYFEDEGVGFWVRCSQCAYTINDQDLRPGTDQSARRGPLLDEVYIGVGGNQQLHGAISGLLSDLMPER